MRAIKTRSQSTLYVLYVLLLLHILFLVVMVSSIRAQTPDGPQQNPPPDASNTPVLKTETVVVEADPELPPDLAHVAVKGISFLLDESTMTVINGKDGAELDRFIYKVIVKISYSDGHEDWTKTIAEESGEDEKTVALAAFMRGEDWMMKVKKAIFEASKKGKVEKKK